jgi:hypothetical protein
MIHLAALCHAKDGFCSVPMVTDFAALYAQEEVPRDLDITIKKLQCGKCMILYCPFAIIWDGLELYGIGSTTGRSLKANDPESSCQVLAHRSKSL